MGPLGPLWGGIAPPGRHMGPLGPFWGGIGCPGATWAPFGPYGADLPPKGATWAPLGALWGGIAPRRRHMGPLGTYEVDLAPSPPGQLRRSSQGRVFPARKRLFAIFGPKMGQKKVEIEGVRPIWRVPERNSVQNPASDVQNGGMTTHFKPNWCHFGSFGVPAPASTPLPGLACPAQAWPHTCEKGGAR